MRTVASAAAVGAALVLAGSSLALAAAPEPEPEPEPGGPRIELVRGPDVDDLTFEVEGNDWPPNTLVQLELCGNRAGNGSIDCVPSTAQTVASNAEGWFLGRVSTQAPPVPCPCVVRAVGQNGAIIATTPVRVAGVPELLSEDDRGEERTVRRIGVVSSRLDGEGPFVAWLGGRPRRTLTLKLVNSGNVPVEDAVLTLSVGPSGAPTGFVPPIDLVPLDVGETATIQVEVVFDSMVFGEQAVVGEIGGMSEPMTFRATTTSYPWLLIVIPAAILLQLVLLRMRDAVRRKAFPEPVEGLPALLPGVREVDDAVFLISIAAHIESETVAMIQQVLGQPEFIAPVDRSCGRAVFALRGMATVRELLEVVVDELRPAPDDDRPFLITDTVDAVHVAALGSVTVEEARATSIRLATWLRDDLDLAVWIDDDPGVAPSPGRMRVSAGMPPLLHRIVLADDVVRADAFGVADRCSDDNVSVRLMGGGGTPFLCVQIEDWSRTGIDDVYDRIAAAVPVRGAGPIGLVPIGVLASTDPDRWKELGLAADETYEVRIATAEQRDVSELLRELMPAARELTP